MGVINLKKKNALGRVFWTLPKELREQIFKAAATIMGKPSRDAFRQYFFLSSKSNPEKLDSELKKYMISVSSQFEGCFVSNAKNVEALERLAQAA